MWSRRELKATAKAKLKTYYWKAFAVSLLLVFFAGGNGGSSGRAGQRFNQDSNISVGQNDFVPKINFDYDQALPWDLMLIFSVIFLVIFVIAISIRIFVGYAFEVGCRKFFVRAAKYEVEMGHVVSIFKGNDYFNVLKVMFGKGIRVFLWSLLLIIPGIVKGYSYTFVPYLLQDNPELDTRRALQISNEMTMGYKWDMFVLDLSFIGWYLLGSIIIIGGIFVNPYKNATQAELYITMREAALFKGITTRNELNLEEVPGI